MTPGTERQCAEAASPLAVARMALAKGGGIGGELEAYVEYSRTLNVKVFNRAVEAVMVAEPQGLGVRAILKGRVGYAFTADLSPAGIDRVVARAADNLQAADIDPYAGLPEKSAAPYPQMPGIWRPGIRAWTLEEKIELALQAEAAALATPDVEVVEEAVYSDEEKRLAVASSRGIEAEAESSFCITYVMAHAGRNGERQSGLGFSCAREPLGLSPEEAGRDAGKKARALLGARPCATGSYTVVLDREIAAALLAALVQALSADAVQKGRSLFADRVGTEVAAPLLSIADDGLAEAGVAANPFDGEGVPQQSTALIEGGILRSFLHNSYTARKQGPDCRSTGNAGRGSYRMMPGVSATNIVVKAGEGTLAELLQRVGTGFYVDSLAGLHSGINPISGEISVGATGHMIEGGAAARPVREVTIATDFMSLLQSVVDLAGDARWIPLYGSVYTPSLAVADVAVSGS